MIFSQIKNQDGTILVISLVILAALLSTAVGFAVFIISDIKQARTIDDAITAYYAADAGLERTLFIFRKDNQDKVTTLPSDDKSGDLDISQSRWTINDSRDVESVVFRQRLYNGQGLKLFFLDRSASGGLPNWLKIDWYKGVSPSNIKLQIIFTQLDSQIKEISGQPALVYYTDYNVVKESDSSLASELPSTDFCHPFKDESLTTESLPLPANYVVEIRVLGSSANDFIDNLLVTAYDGVDCSGEENSTPNLTAINNITIRSVGTHNKARQEIIAHFPPRDPVSGILGFVLFSDEDITKAY